MTQTPGPRTVALMARVTQLERAVELVGDRAAPQTVRAARSALSAVRDRLSLGVDHTVVALAGGTGSGKSSLLNALSGLEFADVGVKRPTTSQVTACVWAHDAGPLLDWLGVARDRRIERESELDGDSQADLRGLVLLDLPDHDSVEPEHRAVVDDLLPHVDLLVWVVDPQKYADDVLHTQYLRKMVGHAGSMLVLLNQIDTVPVAGQASVLHDVGRLLREDGLTGVGVHAVSATTGDGLPAVRGVLARFVADAGVAETRVAAELDDVAALLASTVGPGEPDVVEAAQEAVDDLVAAAGVSPTVAVVRQAIRSGARAPVRLGPVQAGRVAAAHARWLDRIGAGLPEPWQAAVRRQAGDPAALTAAADDRLTGVDVALRRPVVAVVLQLLAALVGLVTLVGVGLTVGVTIDEGELTERAMEFVLAAAVGAGATAILLLAAILARRAAAVRRSRALDVAARHELAAVVNEQLVGPTVEVLEEHRSVRAALVPASTGEPRSGVSTG